MDSWFSFNASIEIDEKTNSIEKLFENKFFDSKSPNTLRAILNTFVTRNSTFHAMNGSGYKYIAKKIIEFDKLNPIVISRFVKVFSRYNYYAEPYKSNMIETMNQYNSDRVNLQPQENQCVYFPSWLWHYVSHVLSKSNNRMSFAFNSEAVIV